ncbi:hypothetical protein L3Q82_014395 [Scortum barcoo]|uniref:Uncharacterized protein n=1 Tax=Scortum barcoo TaxID=214431 RepID=A0ACB8VWI6_9TELE|nr:hypothetical protein L3Q82_014395 [Scortum barcoo]
METKFRERPNADASIPSPQSEAVANELQELSLQPAPSLPIRERKSDGHSIGILCFDFVFQKCSMRSEAVGQHCTEVKRKERCNIRGGLVCWVGVDFEVKKSLIAPAMLEHLPCVRIDPAPHRPPPISRDMDERAIRYELERQACQSLRQVLQLKLQQRRSREELVGQGIMPPLKSSAAFHEHRRSLERARTEDYLKRKIRSRPERSELIRMHILEEPSLQAKQLQLKRARLADDLNDKISHRPGPMELIHKNILPVHSSIKQAIIETQFPKASGDNSSCDEDSNYSLSPEQQLGQESPLSLLPLPSPPETLAGSSIPSPPQVPSSVPPLPPISGPSPSLKLTNGTAAQSGQMASAISQIKFQPKPNSDRSAPRHKKPKDNKPKIKKLKYHQYIPPDQKGDKEPPPHLDSSYAKILQQQQLFLQLQILTQQQQHYNYHAILPAPPKPQKDQQPSASSSSSSTTTSSPPRPVAAPSTAPPNQGSHSRQSSAPLGATKPASLPPKLDEMKVAELKSELKLRSLPVSGTKNDLIERLRTYQELNGGSDTTPSPTAGGTTGPGAEGAGNYSQQQQQFQLQCRQTSSLAGQSGGADAGSSATPAAATPQQLMTVSSPPASLTPSDGSPGAMSPEDPSFNSDPLREMNDTTNMDPADVVGTREYGERSFRLITGFLSMYSVLDHQQRVTALELALDRLAASPDISPELCGFRRPSPPATPRLNSAALRSAFPPTLALNSAALRRPSSPTLPPELLRLRPAAASRRHSPELIRRRQHRRFRPSPPASQGFHPVARCRLLEDLAAAGGSWPSPLATGGFRLRRLASPPPASRSPVRSSPPLALRGFQPPLRPRRRPPESSASAACCAGPEGLRHSSAPGHRRVHMGSPLTQLSLQPCSAAQPPMSIKEEPKCSTPAACQFSLKSASLQKHCLVSSAAPTTTATAVVTMDKDKMLQEKDKQIEELTRMLRQKQRLVEVLRMQLEHRARGGRVPEPLVLLRVKQEPPDKPTVPLSFGQPPFPPPLSSVSRDMDVTKVTVKQEAMEAEEVVPETTMSKTSSETPEAQEQLNTHTKHQQHVCLQQTTLQLAQQQAIQKLLRQQHHSIQNQQQKIQNCSQTLENQQNLQKLSQQRKRKSQKQQLKQQQQLFQSQQQHQQSKQQQMQLKQQILLKQQKLLLQQQNKQQTKQLQQIQIQTKIHLKQQQVLIQQKQQAQQQQPPQVPQAYLNQQSASFPLDLLKNNSTPTLVTDSNGNHFLIALTSHVAENQRTDAQESKATNQVTLQRLQSSPAKLPAHNPVHLPEADNQNKQSMNEGLLTQQKTKPQNGGLQVSVDQPQQEVAQCLSAPPSLQPFFKDQETDPSGRHTSSPSSQIQVCPSLDVLFSPLSPASIKTSSSPDNKDTEQEDDFIDIILQTGETSTTFKPAPEPSLDYVNPNSSATSPPPSPLQLLLSPPIPQSGDTPQSATSVPFELQNPVGTTEETQNLSNAGSGRLEDFLESTTGKPLLGVESGLLTLIDDLHSQMLCTPSILDHPPSPMDTFDVAAEGERGLDSMDWLDLTTGERRGEETPTLAPLGPQTPPSVFSTDFLEGYDLQIHWDSCL